MRGREKGHADCTVEPWVSCEETIRQWQPEGEQEERRNSHYRRGNALVVGQRETPSGKRVSGRGDRVNRSRR